MAFNLLNTTRNCTATHVYDNYTTGVDSSRCNNITAPTNMPLFPEFNVIILSVSLTIQVLLMLLIMGGNGTVLYLFKTHEQLHTVGNAFVVSLALADGLMSIALIPGLIFFDDFFITNMYGCLVLWCSISFTNGVSCVSLLAVTFDRFIRITRPLQYHTIMTWKRVRLIIGSVWSFPTAITIVIPFAGLHRLSPDIAFNCFQISTVFTPEFITILLFGLGVIPFLVMSGIYAKIFSVVLEKIRSEVIMTPPLPCNTARASNPRRELKSIKRLFIILGFTGMAWLPFTVILLLEVYTDYTASVPLRILLSWFPYINSAVNPLIYTLRNDDFRKAWHRHCCSKSGAS